MRMINHTPVYREKYTRWFLRTAIIVFACLIGLGIEQLPAQQRQITLGNEDGWSDITEFSGVKLVQGKRGYSDIVLVDGEYRADDSTDLLLHFNPGSFSSSFSSAFTSSVPLGSVPLGFDLSSVPPDLSSIPPGVTSVPQDFIDYYGISMPANQTTDMVARFGDGSGVFTRDGGGIELTPSGESIFAPGTSWGDFTIEFWLYPATMGEGDVILHWDGYRRHENDVLMQELSCSFVNRKLVWRFANIFLPNDGGGNDVQLSGRRGLIPRKWRHHMLRYRSSSGLLEYLIDGIPEAITHATDSGREGGTLNEPLIGRATAGSLVIGPTYNGLLDEMRISTSFRGQAFTDSYLQRTGTAMSRVFDLEYSNSWIASIEAESKTPGNTDVAYYYRIGESIRNKSEVIAEWVTFTPGSNLATASGRYMQVMVELFPDGPGLISPSVSNIEIFYEPDIPPHAPGWIRAEPRDRALVISWQPSTDKDTAGYLVYYGSKPKQYFGDDSADGPSPVDAGDSSEVILSGLENGKLYYISVVAYDAGSPRHLSSFSHEIAQRPSEISQRPQ